MVTIIANAIQNMERLSFAYDGYPRIVEPHAIGVSRAGNDVLRCYQVGGSGSDGESTGWHLMTVGKMAGLAATGETFTGPRPGYRKGDKGMSSIHCEL